MGAGMTDAGLQAFSGLAAGYDRYRPAYPGRFFRHLRAALDRAFADRAPGRVLDVAAGTGIASLPLARTFPERQVTGIEPNDDMRAAAAGKAEAAGNLSFTRGSAEDLPAEDASADLIFVGQALHWFDRPKAYGEVGRVLRSGGILAIAYNNRALAGSDFLQDYEVFLEDNVPGYRRGYRGFDFIAELEALPWSGEVARLTERWNQAMPLDGFVGLCRSVSYVKEAEEARGSERILEGLRALAERHFPDGTVRLPYESELVTATKV